MPRNRLLELATTQAFQIHCDTQMGARQSELPHKGHFEHCPHPDCALIRAQIREFIAPGMTNDVRATLLLALAALKSSTPTNAIQDDAIEAIDTLLTNVLIALMSPQDA